MTASGTVRLFVYDLFKLTLPDQCSQHTIEGTPLDVESAAQVIQIDDALRLTEFL
jgi:hypothetical protein